MVGSQLHGLATDNSDVDLVHIRVSPIRTMLSPFQTTRPNQKQTDTTDQVFYEFAQFVKLMTQGNATILEVAYSTHKDNKSAGAWSYLTAYRDRLLDKDNIYYAHTGYAHSQLSHVFKDGIDSRRGSKAACAYLRVLEQGRQLLTEGQVTFPLPATLRNVITPIKRGEHKPTAEQFKELALPFETALEDAHHNSQLDTPDIELAEWIITYVYMLTDNAIYEFDL